MRKRAILKKLLSPVLVPATKHYVRKTREARFNELRLQVPPGVFHPSLFYSSKTFWEYISTLDIKEKPVLEIGCGSGAISLSCASSGARVICSDINPDAVGCTRSNALRNKIDLEVFQSDLFEKIPEMHFDLILNNPPYFPKNPSSPSEHAWMAGENLEYFQRFFKQVQKFLAVNGTILMVLSEYCDLEKINRIALANGYHHKKVFQRQALLEKIWVIEYKFP